MHWAMSSGGGGLQGDAAGALTCIHTEEQQRWQDALQQLLTSSRRDEPPAVGEPPRAGGPPRLLPEVLLRQQVLLQPLLRPSAPPASLLPPRELDAMPQQPGRSRWAPFLWQVDSPLLDRGTSLPSALSGTSNNI